jgi:hypothetical protein
MQVRTCRSTSVTSPTAVSALLDQGLRTRCRDHRGQRIGLLPVFFADGEPRLTRLFPQEVLVSLDYVASLAPRAQRRPAAQLFLDVLANEVARRREDLLGFRPVD